MANTAGVCATFKAEVLQGLHVFSATNPARTVNTADTFKAALYLASGSLSPTATTAYSATSEVSGTGYTAGGVTVAGWNTPAVTGSTAYTTPTASFAWTGVTLATAFDTVLIYNSSQGNRAVSLHNFGSQTVTAGNFTLTMPTNDSTNGLIRFT